MSEPLPSSDFVDTKEHRRFAEFCDACKQHRYIGLCYGPPGVGKTVSALEYANWCKVQAYDIYGNNSEPLLEDLAGSNTVLYTPTVVNSPAQIQREVERLRNTLHSIRLAPIRRQEIATRAKLQRREEVLQKKWQRYVLLERDWLSGAPEVPKPEGPSWEAFARGYHQKRLAAPDPTILIVIDEADRLKMASLEQLRDIFDRGGIGLVLVGMPGMEKRLSRYPQLYSRVGFVHAFRPLTRDAVRCLLEQHWAPAGVRLPEEGLLTEETVAAIIRTTGGNFRLLHRLLTQMARLAEINALESLTPQVVEAARESLVIGIA